MQVDSCKSIKEATTSLLLSSIIEVLGHQRDTGGGLIAMEELSSKQMEVQADASFSCNFSSFFLSLSL